MTVDVSIVVGNPRPQSRTRQVAEGLVSRLLEPGTYRCRVVDLAEHAAEVFTPSGTLGALTDEVAASDLAVFASPTYKASYTGLLKAFLDRYQADGLSGVVALPVQTGADRGHSLSPAFTLTPLLLELGATVLGRSAYVAMSEWDRLDTSLDELAAELAGHLGRVAALSAVRHPAVSRG